MGARLAQLLLAGIVAGGAGCDLVFKVDTGVAPGDGNSGGDTTDAPVIAPTGFDEDGDTVDNAFDNCPGISNDQTDGDNGGVGNACDFRLGRVDRIVAKYFFDDPADLNAFTNTGWTVGQGLLQTSGTAMAMLVSKLTLPDASVTAEIGFRVLLEGRSTSQTGVGIDGAGGHRCAVRDSDLDDGNVSSRMLVTLGNSGVSTFGIPELTVGALHHLRLTRDPPGTGDVTCRIDAVAKPSTFDAATVPGEVIIFDDQVPAELTYVAFYGGK